MPIVTTKHQQELSDVRQIAGDKQERDVAFYLRRAFKDSDDIYVFNDYAFSYDDERAQIDHLIVHKYGFLILESKSIYGEVKVNGAGEWARSYNGNWAGIPSPIRQAELQQKLLKKMLVENAADFLGKILGLQQNVGGRKWEALCVVSNTCILHREDIPADINKRIIKSEAVADAVDKIGGKGRLKAFIETSPAFSADELRSIADYLLTRASLAAAPDPEPSAAAPASTPVAEPVTEVREPTTKPAPVAEPAPSAQISCKKCGEAQRLTGSYGKYGYYVKCEACGANTSMRQPCIRCGSKDVKVMKKRQEYWATCSCSDPYLLFTQPRSS
ncbi:nuclease-related domain-containing protein [Marinobacterium litorale]|uniref:nuclease-related domain-containing protein n=1 Tax=Marinobacterium litorale TaxID=404770 RepID=UPI000421B0FD|nr:nuclease-related domain-containing protein [Marinobacterium litorale]